MDTKTVKFAFIILAVVIVVVGAAAYFLRTGEIIPVDLPRVSEDPSSSEEGELPAVAVVAENLSIPWDIAFLPRGAGYPEGAMLVTERPGNLILITRDDRREIALQGVRHVGEGGLMGIALHPDFSQNKWLYLYMTAPGTVGRTVNRVERYRLENFLLSERMVIIDNIPGAAYHDGGRIEFGPDGYLYVATGDALSPQLAQDMNSLAGKIIRMTDEGEIPSDNPFFGRPGIQGYIWSLGHRNTQGLTWDGEGRLWQTEHGPSGERGLCCRDEINVIRPGANYGWPDSVGDTVQPGTEAPARHSGTDTWAPASAEYLLSRNSVFFGGLRGEALYEAVLDGERISELRTHFKNSFGRIRTVRTGPDGMLYITTSNTDGRGTLRANDDKIIRINPGAL